MTVKNKHLVLESNFIREGVKNKLSLPEFLLLSYFDNSFDLTFDVELIKKILQMSEEEILEAYSSLLSKKIIKVETVKNGDGKMCDQISLEPFYQNMILEDKSQEKKQEKADIFSIFEAEFGRTLSSMDFEIINAWLEKGFSEELIKAALKEATYNGVKNLKYIDKILYEWHRKGLKTTEDVSNHMRGNDDEIPEFETKVLNFDWLNESN